MTTCSDRGAWRAVLLHGVCPAAQGVEALVRLSADQYVRVPLPEAEAAAWRSRVGRRVWVDPARCALRAEAPAARWSGHG